MRLRVIWWAGVLLTALLTTGCYDRTELEEEAFVLLLGFDTPKPGIIKVVARVAVPSKLASSGGQGGSSGGGGFDEGTPLLTARGHTVHEALSLMNTGMERSINLSHLSAIVFSEKVAKAGLSPYLRTLTRYREFRRNHYLYVSHGDLEKLLQAEKPLFEKSPTRYIEDLQKTNRSLGYAPSVQVEQFLNSLFSPATDPILPVLAENPQKEDAKMSFLAGSVSRTGGNPVECVGTAIFQKDRMVGLLDGQETRYLLFLNGDIRHFVLSVPSSLRKGSYLSVGVRLSKPATRVLQLRSSQPKLSITQYVEAELLANQSRDSYFDKSQRLQLEHLLEHELSMREEKLINKLLHKKNVAPLSFIEGMRAQFPTYPDYETFPWRNVLKKTAVDVNVKVVLRRLGSQLNTPSLS